MFALPSMWNLVVSTVAFFIATWYVRRQLNEQGTPKGATRAILVFTLASIVSWGAGETADWVQEKVEGPQGRAQTAGDIQQLLNAAGQTQQP